MDEAIKEQEIENLPEQLFVPIIFIVLTGIWTILYFNLLNFYSCSPSQITCFLFPAISWIIWLISSSSFIILCIIKIVKEKKSIDILIFLGYGWLYAITLIMLCE